MRIYLLGNHFENCFFPHCNPFEKRYPTIPKSAPCTPAGLKAMEQLAELESRRRGTNVSVASNEMCTFLILNISSLQLIPVNMIAYRSRYGSANPAVIIAPALVATLFSTIISVIYCKWKDR